mmetsp:Transcript_21987/g.21683  ORF Transcript_21987/g.21683 Transcript_21987/m.21683 type:complete len:96 (+) Transcript_21987:23-310(+)
MMAGGFSNVKPGDQEAQDIANTVKSTVATRTGHPLNVFRVVQYATQVVAGMNYKLKVETDGGEHMHLRVYRPLPHTGEGPQLKDVERGKTLADPL